MKKKTDWVKKVSLLGLLITAGTGLNALAATNSAVGILVPLSNDSNDDSKDGF